MEPKYYREIRKFVDRYESIQKRANLMEEQVNLLMQKKQELELELSQTREEERILIDKIRRETGKEPDFYKMLQQLKNEKDVHVD